VNERIAIFSTELQSFNRFAIFSIELQGFQSFRKNVLQCGELKRLRGVEELLEKKFNIT